MYRGTSILLVVVLATSVFAAPGMKPVPEKAESPAVIKKAVEAFKGFGTVETALFDLRYHELFVLWYCPFSGEDSSYLHAYYYDADTKEWKLFVNELVRSSHELSPAVPTSGEALVISNTKGAEVRRFDIGKFARTAKIRAELAL